ncbi:hypothetical protein [Sphingomonas bacterium]|uniref:hypothetical protein n=1 Tax=Sphingomonas bacterium TaxID=1895847 RepID=UPI001576CE9F|nr:hypothetical protein [Sphingomonas bacterium]
MITTLMIGLWLAMTIAPATPIARTLRVWMVDRPAALLARITRGHVVMMAGVVLVTFAAARWLGDDIVAFLGMGAPEFVAWSVAFDVATYADVAVAVLLISSTVPLRRFASRVVAPIRHLASRHRRMRSVSRGSRRSAANDDEEGRLPTAA